MERSPSSNFPPADAPKWALKPVHERREAALHSPARSASDHLTVGRLDTEESNNSSDTSNLTPLTVSCVIPVCNACVKCNTLEVRIYDVILIP